MSNFSNPSVVEYQGNVEADLFSGPEDDYVGDSRGDDIPPKLWVDPMRVLPLGGDRVEFQTIIVPSTGSGIAPVQIVPRRGNNERKRVTIYPTQTPSYLVLLSEQSQVMVSALGGLNVVSNGFTPFLASAEPYVYESADAIYALIINASATAVEAVTLATESYFPE